MAAMASGGTAEGIVCGRPRGRCPEDRPSGSLPQPLEGAPLP